MTSLLDVFTNEQKRDMVMLELQEVHECHS